MIFMHAQSHEWAPRPWTLQVPTLRVCVHLGQVERLCRGSRSNPFHDQMASRRQDAEGDALAVQFHRTLVPRGDLALKKMHQHFLDTPIVMTVMRWNLHEFAKLILHPYGIIYGFIYGFIWYDKFWPIPMSLACRQLRFRPIFSSWCATWNSTTSQLLSPGNFWKYQLVITKPIWCLMTFN